MNRFKTNVLKFGTFTWSHVQMPRLTGEPPSRVHKARNQDIVFDYELSFSPWLNTETRSVLCKITNRIRFHHKVDHICSLVLSQLDYSQNRSSTTPTSPELSCKNSNRSWKISTHYLRPPPPLQAYHQTKDNLQVALYHPKSILDIGLKTLIETVLKLQAITPA